MGGAVFQPYGDGRMAAADRHAIHHDPRRAAVAVVEWMDLDQTSTGREPGLGRIGRAAEPSREIARAVLLPERKAV
jgi:hypothetical protein